MVLAFDYIGWSVVFAFGLCIIAFTSTMYLREVRGRRRPAQISKWRRAIWSAAFGTVLAGVRRFVIHQ